MKDRRWIIEWERSDSTCWLAKVENKQCVWTFMRHYAKEFRSRHAAEQMLPWDADAACEIKEVP